MALGSTIKCSQYFPKFICIIDQRVTFTGTEKKRFQIEVPESAARRATSEYELQGSRKGFKRYWTYEAKELLKMMMDAEERKDSILKDIARRIFERFDSHR
ncbi:hypothetical protein QYM36_014504 [Artemia franciscana]|uniref:DNA mismatch repair protein MutS clamp domain-containing protein n=1 Tax=Artemia franciscana TaxID=6661 RepID=A0AA88KVQ2_ARTSF|nr:hypothetical protein QYM36_014504 [Artemia franciscana]